jgi:GTP-binding protein EngB required for normal cell division
MSNVKQRDTQGFDWFDDRARHFLEEHAAGDASAIAQQIPNVQHLFRLAEEEVAVCFLGNAGVGKSTLLNALVSDEHDVLPHGGIGPLTAQATVVRHSAEPYFNATYFSPAVLNRILFTLERTQDLLQRRASAAAVPELTLDDEDQAEAEGDLPIADAAGAEGTTEKVDAYVRQVRLLIQGQQLGEIDLAYLSDALRDVLELPTRWGRTPTPEDTARIDRVRACLRLHRAGDGQRTRRAGTDLSGFLLELRDHASGFLAPLIQSLEVGWNADALNDGLVLVDLPGVGVANDEYRKVTSLWIREKARAIALVVEHRGLSDSGAELLRTTGFLNRLLHDSHDPNADPVTLAVIVVKVDEVADSDWRSEKGLKGSAARKWNEHFERVCGEAVTLVQSQMRRELDKLVDDGPEATRPERQAALARLLETLQVHPVSAPQYRLFRRSDDEDPARIKTAEESRIPGVRDALRTLARAHRERARARASTAERDIRQRARTTLQLVRAQWEADTRAAEEALQLADELNVFLAPRQKELTVRQGAFYEFLRETVPAQIEARVGEATTHARNDISKYLRRLGTLHWATLQAVVRKGGAHVSSRNVHIDLPNELALRFEEPVAVIWSKHILAALRKRTSELGGDYVALVAEVVAWAKGQQARVTPRLVEALHDSLAAQTKDLASIGKEAVDDLKKKVREQLYDKLVDRVRKRCEAFVKDKKHESTGAKQRILDLFHGELANAVADIAQPIATKVLVGNYHAVQEEILERFRAYKNPLDAARDSIVTSHEDSVRRSDAKKRRKVFEEADAILAAIPGDDR